MRFAFIFLLALLAGCSGPKDYDKKIVGSWEIYSLNGKADLYKAFVGATMIFNSDGSFSKGDASKTYLEGTYKINGEVINMKSSNKEHSSIITISDTKLSFEKDFSFTRGDVPMKSVYRKK